ncbi:MAG: hypothetical protein E6G21_04810 [Actinobacteria bacterium]|nr:MAG: hypothetical protein E6G21_04810 [Actinomycetota bacterium]
MFGLAGATAAVSLAFGFLLGADPLRALAIGFYLCGSFLIAIGFLLGNRGPARMRGDSSGLPFAPRRACSASCSSFSVCLPIRSTSCSSFRCVSAN